MRKDTIVIREIEAKDNPKITNAIRTVLIEMGVPKVGTAYEDSALDCMLETYSAPKKTYFVVESGNEIIGGAGISPLDNYEGNVCELQKMYFMPEARGKGLGTEMMNKCLNFARAAGFDQCYLETLPYMNDARKLYKRVGFESIDEPMGDTGHYSCTVWMLKDL
ncbi:GNAT family N-acetyltransferase [Winogradskyella bathintestinalis]|uniref:GNAT family N-acetyltransferase n=1 Tax=Winogradskyella bathintestinalis TaxID=3035208 RepID=A0ABT7ZYP8_9FLAO|nr:GNAT family N-acetyltransferase [Winogradskyella bathintestinalis]MDN3494021.1 GNAT family N-acetyltransferase [Winogradskyella bathintestinalis]